MARRRHGALDLAMPIEFHSLSMMDLRSRPGEVLDEVARNGQAYVIERNGQQKACLVPISFFLPDIRTSRIASELDKLSDAEEHYRVVISESREIQLIFRSLLKEADIEVSVTLPHGYPNSAPIVMANPIDESCPHRWKDGSLCIYGAMDIWNPGKHDVLHVIKLCRRWLENYATWEKTAKWPAQEES